MLIGLHGKKKSGKDTAFGFIDDYFIQTAPNVVQKRYSEKMKQSAFRLFYPEIDAEDACQVSDYLKREIPCNSVSLTFEHESGMEVVTCTGREFLQRYGTESHRDLFGPDFWVDQCLPLGYDHSREVAVVTDVRFENEAQRIHDLGGTVWQLLRPSEDQGDAHASEVPLPDILIDIVIENTGTLEDFQRDVSNNLHQLTTGVHAHA